MRSLIFGLIAFLCVFTACKQKEQVVSKEEALALARIIDSAIDYRKPVAFDNLINADMLAARIAKNKGVADSPSFQKDIKAGFSRLNMGNQIMRGLGDKGTYQLVKYYEKDKVQHLVYRLHSSDGLNYHDFELSKINGKTYIADIYIYLAGQTFSSLLADLASSFIQKNGKEDPQVNAAADALKIVRAKMQNGDHEGARKTFDQDIPAYIAKEKMFRLISIQISAALDDEKYLRELTEFQKAFPDEPNAYLLMIDVHILQKDYPNAINSINSLDKIIDKDPFLDYYRALVYNMMEDKEQAITHLESVYRQYPDFEEGALELIANYLQAKMTDKAAALIEVYKKNPDFDQQTLEMVLAMYQ